jgi:hypothetical protein
MRLISTTSYRFECFREPNIPRYTILSHTWAVEGEVTYADVSAHHKHHGERDLHRHPGYLKLRRFCEVARDHGFVWCWLDGVCIDRSSCAEVSEAIACEWEWFRNAALCIVHLSDVPTPMSLDQNGPNAITHVPRWFARGWTLPELIAPANVQFYGASWQHLGSKYLLRATICALTGIDEHSLFAADLASVSVARRMAWAAGRTTARGEDAAYSLLGLFDVQIAVRYGEGGRRAFVRVQEEILRETEDHSLFAWRAPASREPAGEWIGVLAESPANFAPRRSGAAAAAVAAAVAASEELPPGSLPPPYFVGEPHEVTNRGIKVHLPLLRDRGGGGVTAILNCRSPSNPDCYIGLPLVPMDEDPDQSSVGYRRYAREGASDLADVSARQRLNATPETIYLLKSNITRATAGRHLRGAARCWLRALETGRPSYRLARVTNPGAWSTEWRTMDVAGAGNDRIGRVGLEFTREDGRAFVLLLLLDAPLSASPEPPSLPGGGPGPGPGAGAGGRWRAMVELLDARRLGRAHGASANGEGRMAQVHAELERCAFVDEREASLMMQEQLVCAKVEVADVRGARTFVLDVTVETVPSYPP